MEYDYILFEEMTKKTVHIKKAPKGSCKGKRLAQPGDFKKKGGAKLIGEVSYVECSRSERDYVGGGGVFEEDGLTVRLPFRMSDGSDGEVAPGCSLYGLQYEYRWFMC